MRPSPLFHERKQVLDALLDGAKPLLLRSERFEPNGKALYEVGCDLHLPFKRKPTV